MMSSFSLTGGSNLAAVLTAAFFCVIVLDALTFVYLLEQIMCILRACREVNGPNKKNKKVSSQTWSLSF